MGCSGGLLHGQGIDGEGSQPVVTEVVPAGDVGQGFGEVFVCDFIELGFVRREVAGDAVEVPGAA